MFTKPISNRELLIQPPVSGVFKSGCIVLHKGEEIGEHITTDKEEILVIMEGTAHVVCEMESSDVPAPAMVYISKNKKHNVINQSEKLLKYLFIVVPVS